MTAPTPHPYPAYKPSGDELIGDVPEHWDVRRLKHAVQINPETLIENTDPEYLFDYMDINSVGTGQMSTPLCAKCLAMRLPAHVESSGEEIRLFQPFEPI